MNTYAMNTVYPNVFIRFLFGIYIYILFFFVISPLFWPCLVCIRSEQQQKLPNARDLAFDRP